MYRSLTTKSVLALLCLTSLNSCFLFEEPEEPSPMPTTSHLSTIEPLEGENIQLEGEHLTTDMRLYLDGTELTFSRLNHRILEFTLDETHNSGWFYAIYQGDTLHHVPIAIQDNPWQTKYTLPTIWDDWYSQDFVSEDDGFVSISHTAYSMNHGVVTNVFEDSNLTPIQMPEAGSAIIHKDWQMLKTTDNGYTWQRIDLPDGYIFDELYFSSAQKGLALGHRTHESGSIILSTEDGGLNWKEIWEYPTDLFTYYETKVSQTEAGQLYIAAPHKNILVFSDANGEHWEVQDIIFPYATNSESLVYAVTQEDIWMQNVAGLYHTTNGGERWEAVAPGYMNSSERARMIRFFNEQEGIILTSRGGIFTTSDGGESWKGRYTTAFEGITFLPESRQFMVRQGSNITTRRF